MTEFTANSSLHIQAEIKQLEKQIRNSVGIVPANVYDRLDQLQLTLMKRG